MAHHGNDVTGVVSGFDRLRLQGSLLPRYCPELLTMYLERAGVLYKDFKQHVVEVTTHIRSAAESIASGAGRPIHYLRSTARGESVHLGGESEKMSAGPRIL